MSGELVWMWKEVVVTKRLDNILTLAIKERKSKVMPVRSVLPVRYEHGLHISKVISERGRGGL
jgi:hypothetical protein